MMRQATLSALLVLTMLSGSCHESSDVSRTSALGQRVGWFKDWRIVEQTMRARLIRPNGTFRLLTFLGDSNPDGLASLLGGFAGNTGSTRQENAMPNAVNSMLWQVIMNGASASLAQAACRTTGTELSASFRQFAIQVCSWRTMEQRDPAVLQDLWLVIAGYDLPEAEFQSFLSLVLQPNSPLAALHGEELLRELLLSVFSHPNFLLHQ